MPTLTPSITWPNSGQLPIAEGGRIKPFDTLARTTLQYLSERQVVLPDKYRDETDKVSATQWLLEVISGVDAGFDRSVFRITNVELVEMLGLEPKPGFFRYSYNEVLSDRQTLQEQMEKAQKVSNYERTIVQHKTLELANKIAFAQQSDQCLWITQIWLRPRSDPAASTNCHEANRGIEPQ